MFKKMAAVAIFVVAFAINATAQSFPNYSGGTSLSMNQINQAPSNGFIVVTASGSYENSLTIYVGATSPPTTLVWAMGDDINNNSKSSSAIVPITQNMYYKISTPGSASGLQSSYAFETVTAYFYPANAGIPNTALWVTSGTQQYDIAGNVGIGTTTPAYPLDVNGDINVHIIHALALELPGGGTISTSGSQNIAIGSYTLPSATTGDGNIVLGNGGLQLNTSGGGNTALGTFALNQNTSGGNNTATGNSSLNQNTTGSSNTAYGLYALFANTSGSNNTAIGSYAGWHLADGTTPNQTSSYSTYLGFATAAHADSDTNEVVIGANAVGAGSNTVTLGNTAITSTILRGNVGIGTTAPSQALEVAGNIKLDGASPTSATITFGDNTVQSTAWNGVLSGGDWAESVDVIGERKQYEPGDVMIIDSDQPDRFLKSSKPYSTMVAGIYSTKPALIGRHQEIKSATWQQDEVPMAMMGIVPVKVSAENGAIKPGDLLVSSSTAGYAMKGTDRERLTGAVIGKAMGHLESGSGMIQVLVSLQ